MARNFKPFLRFPNKSSNTSPDSEHTPVTLTVRVTKINFPKNPSEHKGWCCGRCEDVSKKTNFSFKGNLFVVEGNTYKFVGYFEEDPQWGKQMTVTSVSNDIPLDLDGLTSFLAKNKKFAGIGEKKAKMLVDAYGDQLEKAILEDPQGVALHAKVSLDTAIKLQEAWKANASSNAISSWLMGHDLTHYQATRIIDKYGDSSKDVLTQNPYLLIDDLEGFGFKKTDDIALKIGIDKDSEHRIRKGVLFVCNEELNNGHCWSFQEHIVKEANELLYLDGMDAKKRIKAQVEWLINNKQLAVMLPIEHDLKNDNVVALPMAMNAEKSLYENIIYLSGKENPHFDTDDLTAFDVQAFCTRESETTKKPNAQQVQAIRSFLRHGISVISGGAGTGKTFVVGHILAQCKKKNLSVALCAPTGKAAKRIEESTGYPAMTIHRLLGAQGNGEFLVDRIEEDVLIVDESSMMDVFLANTLLSAVSSKTAVVIIGDHNQLPSVGAGNFLRDLIATNLAPTTVLTECMRQSGILKSNSNDILDGIVQPTPASTERVDRLFACKTEHEINTTINPRPWYNINHCYHKANNMADIKSLHPVIKVIKNLFEVKLKALRFDPYRDVQVLCPTKKSEIGVECVNSILQAHFQKTLFANDLPEISSNPAKTTLYVGDKVIQTKNDYENDIMNGDMGYILSIDNESRKKTITIDFGTAEKPNIVVLPKAGHSLQLAYCLTIHKSQGSEFPCVIIICSNSHSFQLNRNLLYTAVTRASQTAFIVGDELTMTNTANKEEASKRRTFLSIFGKDKTKET